MENYKQNYKEALERAKKLQKTCDSQAVVGWCEYLFPELKESKDEKIRKNLMEWFEEFPDKIWRGNYKKDVLAWLEKQSNKSVNIDIESMVSAYKQKLKSQGGVENSPLVNMCLIAFREGVEEILEELNLKKFEK